MRIRNASYLALMLASATIAPAAEGRIPLLSLPGPPYVITQPGHYILTRNIAAPATSVVSIQSDDVTLDLGGHTITGSASSTDDAISVTPPTATRGITIRNGRIVAGNGGVRAATAVRIRIRLERLDITESQSTAISVVADQVQIVDCHIHDLAGPGWGINLNAYGGAVLDNRLENLAGGGMEIVGFRDGQIRRNVVRSFGMTASAVGIELSESAPEDSTGSVIADNLVSGPPGGVNDSGINIFGSNNLLSGNIVSDNGTFGIVVVGSQNRLERNVTNRNGNDGLRLVSSSRTYLEANQSQENARCGVDFGGAGGHIYRNNLFGNNTLADVCGVASSVNAGGNYCGAALCP